MFAEHNDWVLRELLDLNKDEIAKLRQEATTPMEPVDR
jgi:hypothetical protein